MASIFDTDAYKCTTLQTTFNRASSALSYQWTCRVLYMGKQVPKKVIRNLHNLTVRNACKGKSTNLIERLGEVPCAVLRAMF